MSLNPNIVILAGGVGAEREVSILSGQALSDSLSQSFPTRLIEIHTRNSLPISIPTAMLFFLSSMESLGKMVNYRICWRKVGLSIAVVMYHQANYASIKPRQKKRYFWRLEF